MGSAAAVVALATGLCLVPACSMAGGATSDEPVPSPGCGTSRVGPGEEATTLLSGGSSRLYIQHVPPAHDGSTPLPLVIDLHGFNEGAVAHADYTRLGDYGDEQGFVTITPQGRGQVAAWDTEPGSGDVVFIDDLLDRVEANLCIDLDRVYATGVSNGAMLASTLACDSSDRIAAIAPVAGVAAVPDCAPERPVPIAAFHGTDDPAVRYDGGFGPGVAELPTPSDHGPTSIGASQPLADLPVPEVMDRWAELYGCDAGTEEEHVAEDVTLVTEACPGWSAVELYRVEGGGHTWPGARTVELAEPLASAVVDAGRTSPVSANALMWAFFEDHPRWAGGPWVKAALTGGD
ncbi:MAG TPA: PHB depolymerase family esterase [Acidimicrobiales bacterium]